MPGGELVTVPLEPVAACTVTDSSLVMLNCASTLSALSIVTVQVPVPLHAPNQPTKAELTPAAAVSVTTVPGA